MNETFLIESKIYRKILKEYKSKSQKPSCFLLGKGFKTKKLKVDFMIELETGNQGCSEMPNITPSSLSLGLSKLMKKKKQPIGLIRIGLFGDVFDDERGSVVEDLNNMVSRTSDFYFISFSGNDLSVEDVNNEGVRVNWAIV